MSKQDRTQSRTPSDTERKFLLNLGKSFAEILGIANDVRTKAEKTEEKLSIEIERLEANNSENLAELELKVDEQGASIDLIVENGEVKGGVLIAAINSETLAKISADRLDIEGKTLNIKVAATNITGKLTASQINADGLKATNADISGKVAAKEGSIGGWTIGDNLTAKTSSTSGGIYQEQTVTLSIEGVTVSSIWTTAPGWTGPTPAFPSGVVEGQNYGPKFVSWAELLKVYE